MAWRNCGASLALLDAVNARWPQRDKTSDGAIGDAAHATRASDHNPWVVVDGMGVVRARDIDVDGIDAAWCVEQLRLLGAAGDIRLRGGGYVIFNRRITAPNFSGWKSYTGSNPHDKHFHVSFSLDRGGFDSSAPWPFLQTARTPAPEEEDDMPKHLRAPNGTIFLFTGDEIVTTVDPAQVDRWADLFGPWRNISQAQWNDLVALTERNRPDGKAPKEFLQDLARRIESLSTPDVDEDAIAAKLSAVLAGKTGGVTAADVKAAVREVLTEGTNAA